MNPQAKNSRHPRTEGGKRLRLHDGISPESDPLISIVTVVLNGAKELERTIRSVLGQSFRDFEFIVLDGGSTDGTPEILRSYEDQFDYWRSEPDKGISDAFNKGIELSRGTLIGLLNAGDWYEQDTLSTVFDAWRLAPDAEVFCGSIQFWEKDSPALFCHSNPDLIDREMSIYHPTVFVKKDVYQRLGPYDVNFRYAMDYELLLRFRQSGAKFHNVRKKLANMSLDGVSQANWYAGLKEVREARAEYFPLSNVVFFHIVATLKNLIALGLKWLGLRSLYHAYWHSRNNSIAGNDGA